MIMENKTEGWVVVNENHPSGATPFIVTDTFSYTRKNLLKDYVKIVVVVGNIDIKNTISDA